MFIKDEKRFDPFRPHEINGIRYPHIRDPQLQADLGITEIPDPTPPEDFSDDTYYVTTQNEAPYVIWTRKSDEQIAQAQNSRLQQQIENEERSSMVPRVVREFMLGFMEANATPEQLAENIGYTKVKALDDTINAKRQQIVKLPDPVQP